MLDMEAVRQFASRHDLWVVEDAAHAFPAAWRPSAGAPWQRAGEGTANVTGFSFYANKTITTGEGGMAVTESDFLADRMRLMSLHGLSRDAWHRYTGGGWDYRIVAPGFKYNLTDIASALGLAQLARADELRQARERIARAYLEHLAGFDELELPPTSSDRLHAWHLFPIRLHLDRLNLTREAFVEAMKNLGVVCSVHWRPLHLHPYYQDHLGYRPEDCPTASAVFPRLVSLPIFPDMTMAELDHVVKAIASLLARHQRSDVKRTAS